MFLGLFVFVCFFFSTHSLYHCSCRQTQEIDKLILTALSRAKAGYLRISIFIFDSVTLNIALKVPVLFRFKEKIGCFLIY